MKVDLATLESLVDLYGKETELKKLRVEHTLLSQGEHLTQKHEEILALSQEVSGQRATVEEMEATAYAVFYFEL